LKTREVKMGGVVAEAKSVWKSRERVDPAFWFPL
jgi:hypothetical protein